MGITLKEIAAMAGVHKSTVDKVIHNRPGVSDAKRAEIRRLLEEYQYESNPLAKALNYQKKKMSVAVVMPKVDAYGLLKKGMELVRQDFASFNIDVQFYEMLPEEGQKQAKILQDLKNRKISGVVLLPIQSEEVLQAMRDLNSAGIPVVTVNTDLSEAPKLCYVGQDMKMGGRVAARMMDLKLSGEGQIGIITGRLIQATRDRSDAFVAYISEIDSRLKIVEIKEIYETEAEARCSVRALMREWKDLDAIYITCGNVKAICNEAEAVMKEENTNKMPVIICHERYEEIQELIRKNIIFVSINGQLISQGRLAMRILFESLIYDRKPDQDKIFVGNEVLLKENV